MKILIQNNGYLDGISGGDKHITSIAEEWSKKEDIEFILPKFAEKFINGKIKKTSYYAISPKKVFPIILEYLIRMRKAKKEAKRIRADI